MPVIALVLFKKEIRVVGMELNDKHDENSRVTWSTSNELKRGPIDHSHACTRRHAAGGLVWSTGFHKLQHSLTADLSFCRTHGRSSAIQDLVSLVELNTAVLHYKTDGTCAGALV